MIPRDRFDWLLDAGTLAGMVGFGMIALPLALLFLCLVLLFLAYVTDSRTTAPPKRTRKPKVTT